jgi:hypothetical protein
MVLDNEDAYIRDLQYGVRGTGYGFQRRGGQGLDSNMGTDFAIRVTRAPRHPGRVLDIWAAWVFIVRRSRIVYEGAGK